MPVADVSQACRDAAAIGFHEVVITGGEPLAHPDIEQLLEALGALRSEVKPLRLVLRSNLVALVDRDMVRRLEGAVDQVTVSVDGDRETHDRQRGKGSYDTTVANLRALVATRPTTDVRIAATLPCAEPMGSAGESVRSLARRLGLPRPHFRPLLPLGRAKNLSAGVVPDAVWGHLDAGELISQGFAPASSCGIGQNLFVEPDGSAYPCYALHGEGWCLGKVGRGGGLETIAASEDFRSLGRHTVETNPRCSRCALRYLCGGACRAWFRKRWNGMSDLDAPPAQCDALHHRARSLLDGALTHLRLSGERWLAAGLPAPEEPPRRVGKEMML